MLEFIFITNHLIFSAIMNKLYSSIIIFLLAGFQLIQAQTPAFPGAEGYGKYASGGREGSVYEVTNLNDSGPGSLRDAVSQSNRTVVFRVSGDIELKSALFFGGNNITVAGQTAPGDGICVRDYPTIVSRESSPRKNIIIRYVRFRLGDRYGLSSDALNINDGQNIILDHCTMSWGGDECFSAYGNQNITVQYCIIGEGLNYKGHSMGGLWGGYTTYHHNLIHTNGSRHPKYAYTYDEDITDSRNNVIYNWGYQSAYTSPTGRVNLVNNYYKAGPATGSGVRDRIVQGEPTKRMYITGNYVAGYPGVTADNWNGGVDPLNGGIPIRYDVPFTVPNPLPEQSAQDAYLEIVSHAGASFPTRDDADLRAIKNLIDSTGFILTRQSDAGGFPKLYSLPPPTDSDHDGMPDDYETAEGLNPNDAADRNGDKNGNGYTNLEDYLNGLPLGPAGMPKPGFVTADPRSEYRINLDWFDLNTDEKGFIIERSVDSSGFAVLDTVAAGITAYIDSLVTPSTKYYYRIKSYKDSEESVYAYSDGAETFPAGSKPVQAVMTSPQDDQTEISITGATLSWEQGNYALAFNVYLGESEASLEIVDSATTVTTYHTGSLEFGTDYYWRIDALNENGITAGEVWKFTTVSEAVPELVLYWPFKEEDGIIVYDSTENGNNGTLMNVDNLLRGEGPFDRSISLANVGPQGHIQVPDNPTISFDDNPFSIAFWMRLDQVSDSSVYIFHKGSFNSISGTERNGKWFGLEMRRGIFRFAVDDNDHKTELGSTTPTFVTGEWVHVVIIRNVFTKIMRLYKNGGLVSTATDNTGGISQSLPLVIGNSDHMYPEHYGGDIDENSPYRGELAEFIICRHPLSKEEIELLYNYNRIPTLATSVPDITPAPVSDLSAYPNPFSEEICLDFRNGFQNHVFVEIYDVNGRLVRSMKRSVIPDSRNRLYWDGKTDGGISAGRGLYLVILRDRSGIRTGKTLVIKN